MRSGPLLLLVILVAGLAIGYVIGVESADAPVDPGDGDGPPAPATRSPELAPAASDEFRIVSVVRVPDADLPRGSGRIAGTCLDPDGRPLAGVVVKVYPVNRRGTRGREGPRNGSPPPEPPIEQVASEYGKRVALQRAWTWSATTDADGRFAVTGLPDEDFHVHAWWRGLKFSVKGGSNPIRPGMDVTLVSTHLLLVDLTLVLPDGTTPDRTWVSATTEGRGTGWYWEPGQTTNPLAAGGWTIEAKAGDYQEFVSEKKTIRLSPETSPLKVLLPLRPCSGIRVRVFLRPGMPPMPMRVIACPAGSKEGDGHRQWHAEQFGRRFFVRDLPPGDYVVRLRGMPATASSEKVTLDGKSIADVDLRMPEPDPDFSVMVKVTGPDGNPVPGVRLSERVKIDGGSRSGGGHGLDLGDGRYQFFFDRALSDLRREHPKAQIARHVVARSTVHGEESVEVPDGVERVELSFVVPAKVTLVVDNWGKTGHEPRILAGFSEGKPASPFFSGQRLGSDGTKVFGPIRPGVYTFFLLHPIGSHRNVPIASYTVSLAAGESRVSLSIPALHELTAAIEGGGRKLFQISSPEFGWESSPDLATSGEITWKLPPGVYLVHPWGSHDFGPPRKVRVPGDRRVVFTKIVPDCFLVTLSGEGVLADAGFADGDHIVAIDGKELKERGQMYALRTLASSKESVKVAVLRSGKPIELTVPGSLFGKGPKQLGGRYDPAARPK